MQQFPFVIISREKCVELRLTTSGQLFFGDGFSMNYSLKQHFPIRTE